MVIVLAAIIVMSANPPETNSGGPLAVPGDDSVGGPYSNDRELVVWRSRKELPRWLRRHVPTSFDFDKEMLAGPSALIAAGVPVRLSRTTVTVRDGKVLIEERFPQPDCHCTGVYRGPPPGAAVHVAKVVVWIVPRGTKPVVLRTHGYTCPPCLAP
jgi:hypothetical protein